MVLRLIWILILLVVIDCVITYPTEMKSKSSKALAKKHRRLNSLSRGLKELELADLDASEMKEHSTSSMGRPRKRSRKNKTSNGHVPRSSRSDGTSNASKFLGLGVFGDMRKFFNELRTNLDTSEATDSVDSNVVSDRFTDISQVTGEELPSYQALRMGSEGDRRQSRLRGFVSMVEPLRRNHQYDPSLLWTGLGR